MNISAGVILKILGASVATIGTTAITWKVIGEDGKTEWDSKLIENIEGITNNSSITQGTETNEPKTTTYTMGGGGNANKLVTTTSKETTSSAADIFKFKITSNDGNTVQEIHNGMKHWECKLSGTGLETEITKIKESFGIKAGVTQIKQEHKESMVKFISSCAYYGKPWKPSELNEKDPASETKNNKLSRTVKIENSEDIAKFYKPETPN